MSHFFAHLARMKLIYRWPLMRNVTHENIAEHSLQVGMVAHGLAVIGNTFFDKDYNSVAENTLALQHAQHLVNKSLKISNLAENKEKTQAIYWALSWNYIFIKKFKEAEAAFNKAIDFGAGDGIYSNLAATYLFNGEWQKAEKIYKKYKDKKDGDDTMKNLFLTDLDEIEKALGKPEHIKEIREMLKK